MQRAPLTLAHRPLLLAVAGLCATWPACADSQTASAPPTSSEPPAAAAPATTDADRPSPSGTETAPPFFGLKSSGELRLGWHEQRANAAGPLAAANAVMPGTAAPPVSSAVTQAELRGQWHTLTANVLLQSERPDGGPVHSSARVNELYASADLGAWQASVGKKVVSWDVGYAWRPNDMVQQEERRQLGPTSLAGRPLLQLEVFDAERAASLVWVQPQPLQRNDTERFGADESALAARYYQRLGTLDAYVFARAGQHTHASLGSAAAWVATDALELHGSLRWSQQHDGIALDPAAGTAPVSRNPWQTRTLGAARQTLLGLNWTGQAQQSLIAEWWWDGSAPSDSDWQRWQARNAALSTQAARPGLPAAARTGLAGNLAWQTTPLASTGLRRQNVYLRSAWQPEPWTLAADLLWTPADAGRISSLSAKWQGDRLSVEAAWRVCGGPTTALTTQLPSRQAGTLTAIWSF
ncbi:MAG: hypothetical protein AB3X44_06205 [Leptothrix sp. (in: b-proteobacteria)]